MQALRLGLVQGETRWHDAAANRAYYGELLRSLKGQGSDLIMLPETFLSGFTNDTLHQAEDMDGAGVHWLRALAADLGAVITGSLVVREGGRSFNRLLWMQPDGQCLHYDKRHLFRMAGEHERYAGGAERLIVEIKGWRVLPQVCYDLRFPVWLRNRRMESATGGMDYDLLLFVANWPEPRRHAWRTLLRARAIENLACVAAVNRVGRDGNGLDYAGDSVVLDALGQPLMELGRSAQAVTVMLDPAALLAHRARFPAWMDADDFSLSEI
ncbi:MAG: amidohydrolase [Metallibacterium sp.]